MKGILNINKPCGITSHTVISRVRKILGTRDVGHMGTLDPQGTGVLLVGVGKATRLFDFFLGKDKVYEADFEFGYETDTLDGDGTVLKTGGKIPSLEEIVQALKGFSGELMQMPPNYSAKKIDGFKAYELARRGKEVQLKAAPVTVYSAELISKVSSAAYKFKIHCSAGTYIRSICRDLAYKLSTYATMTSICRTRAGDFTLEGSVTLDELEQKKENALICLDDVLKSFPRVDLDDALYEKVLNGIKIPFSHAKPHFSVYCRNELFGLGIVDENGILKIKTFLKD